MVTLCANKKWDLRLRLVTWYQALTFCFVVIIDEDVPDNILANVYDGFVWKL